MKNSQTLDADAMNDAFTSGYSRKQIVMSIILACVLHVVLLGGYIVLGTENKRPAAAATKKEDAKAPSDTARDSSKSPASTKSASNDKDDGLGKSAVKSNEPATGDTKKNEVAKPGEVPTAPDSDIDTILKTK